MNVLLVGCGNIGFSLLTIWVQMSAFQRFVVVQPSLAQAKHFKENSKVEFIRDLENIPHDFQEDLVALAVKPQHISCALAYLAKRNRQASIVSLAAGVNISALSAQLPEHPDIFRLMPNLALKTGKSVNLAFAPEKVSFQKKKEIESLFQVSGQVIWLDQEKHLDTLTAISGSGPAYFFLLAEILINETKKLGIPDKTARIMIKELFLGSASLLATDETPEDARKRVTSKGGVTEAALSSLKPEMEKAMDNALQAAFLRLQELQSILLTTSFPANGSPREA